jgi:hypothetical protein
MEIDMSKRTALNLGMMLVIALTIFGFFNTTKVVYAYHHTVQLSTPTGNVQGGIYDWDSQVDKIYTSATAAAGTQYYIFVHGKVWGQCSPDMTGCTYNRWKVKDNRVSEKWWNGTTDILNLNVRGLHGIGVVKHSVIHRPGYPTVTGYTSEHGTSYANGANSGCFYYGPALNANTLSGLPCP